MASRAPVDPQINLVTPSDPRYPYIRYQTRTISVEQLDALAAFVLNTPEAKWFSQIFTVGKMFMVFAYLYSRAKLVEEAVIIDKHNYEQSGEHNNQDEVDRDAVIGVKK